MGYPRISTLSWDKKRTLGQPGASKLEIIITGYGTTRVQTRVRWASSDHTTTRSMYSQRLRSPMLHFATVTKKLSTGANGQRRVHLPFMQVDVRSFQLSCHWVCR